ncbi:zinc-finger double domain-containing protein [Ditylenchus destructor]|uniref:Zinc-finger double domain-containing protein n=1 Tax=Ditylenchus destructor TaxID=166010 RepID=A0AAD4N502_9BILA|nr:zinc-finger double domain-containing protein [Ditylenchus destructor]
MFECTFCSHTSTNNAKATIHMRTHTGEKPYNCDVCSYTCAYKGNLKSHLRTHTGEKPYKCNICSYASAQNSGLKKHMRNHSGETPNKCDERSNVSSGTNDLQKHMRTPTSERSYRCGYCRYTYADIPTLQEHMGIHTDVLFNTENLHFHDADTRQIEISGCSNNFEIVLHSEINGSGNDSPDHVDNEELANDEINPEVCSEDCQVAKSTENETSFQVECTEDGHFTHNDAVESAASSEIVVSTKRPPNRPSVEGCLFLATKILLEISRDLDEISDLSPAENNIVNDSPLVTDLDSDEEKANECDETNPGVCGEDNQVANPAENETNFQVEYTEDGHFDFDDEGGLDNGILKEHRDEDTCAIQ